MYEGELTRWYTALGRIRRQYGCFAGGEFVSISAALGCVAYARLKDGSGVIVVANMNDREIDYYLPPEWHGTKLLLDGISCAGATVKLGAYSAAILKAPPIYQT